MPLKKNYYKLNDKKKFFHQSQMQKTKSFFSKTHTSFKKNDQKTSRDNKESLKLNNFIMKKEKNFNENNDNLAIKKEYLEIQTKNEPRELSIDESLFKKKTSSFSKLSRTRNKENIKNSSGCNKNSKNSISNTINNTINNTIINYYNLTNSPSSNNDKLNFKIINTSISKKRNYK